MTYMKAKKSYSVCVNMADPKPSRRYSNENNTLAHVAHIAYAGVMACNAPNAADVLANAATDATSRGERLR